MALLKHKDVEREGIAWLKKNGWKLLDENILNTVLFATQMENIPYKPHILVEKDGYKFFIIISNKEEYYPSKKHQEWMTGFDWYKFKFSKAIGDKTGIPIAVLFHNEQLNEFIFRQLDELPNPDIWHRDSCLAAQYMRPEKLNCYQCWKLNPHTANNCVKHRKVKTTTMSMWFVNNFSDNTTFQPKLFEYGLSKDRTIFPSNTKGKGNGPKRSKSRRNTKKSN